MQKHIGIIGLGPRGLNLLERLLANISVHDHHMETRLHLHIIEPGPLGCGVHAMDQPRSLLVNTVANQITMYADESVKDAGPALDGPCFYTWARNENYKYDETSRTYTQLTGRTIQANDYLPRALFGQYLHATANTILKKLQAHCDITIHAQEAIKITPCLNQAYLVTLQDNTSIHLNALFLTTGHSTNVFDQHDEAMLQKISTRTQVNPYLGWVVNPYPIAQVTAAMDKNMAVAIEGFGLTATDIISELTIGKGGQFKIIDKQHYQYIRSGHEPQKIVVYSKSGLPFAGRATNQKGASTQYKAQFFTLEALQERRIKQGVGINQQLDFEKHVLPLLQLEMRYCYALTYFKKQTQDHNAMMDYSQSWIMHQNNSQMLNTLEDKVCQPEQRFNWQSIMDPFPHECFASESAYHAWIIGYLKQDIEQSVEGNVNNPVKAAYDVLRDLRDTIRAAIDFGGLTPESHALFMTKYMPVMNRISVGPPKERIMELLALIEANVVDIDVGRAPQIKLEETTGKFHIQGQNIHEGTPRVVDTIIKARIASPDPRKDQSRLMQNALQSGLFRPFMNGDYHPGGIDIDKEFHTINQHGAVNPDLFALGTPTEGPKFYTYIVPRSGVNSTALVDAGKLVLTLFNAIKAEEKSSHRLSLFHRQSATRTAYAIILALIYILLAIKLEQTPTPETTTGLTLS